jgi:hypothetical protein
MWRIAPASPRMERVMVSFIERLKQAEAKLAEHEADPLREKLEVAVRGKEAIGTYPLLDLLGLPKTTCNARRISGTMRSLGFVPLKSRRFLPGGHCGTVTRGWMRPFRETRDAQPGAPTA